MHGEKTDNHSIRIYVNKIENSVTFKIKIWYYLKLLTPETIRLLAGIKNKIFKYEIVENGSHLEIIEVALIHFNTVNSDC